MLCIGSPIQSCCCGCRLRIAKKAGFDVIHNFGGNIMITPSKSSNNTIEISKNRGKKVLNKLLLLEKTAPLRNWLIPASLKQKAHYINYLFYLGKALQKFKLIKFGL